MKWSKKHDRYILNKTMNEQKVLQSTRRFDKLLLATTIICTLLYVGLGVAYLIWK